MDTLRRTLLQAGAGATASSWLPSGAAASSQGHPTTPPDQANDAVPSLPLKPPEGRAGDFDFLTGEWRIHNRTLIGGKWIEYPGEATVTRILGGVGSVEELRIPARNFSGMGLRLLDVEKRVWSDFWVNARSGVLTTPGQTGGFDAGVGFFWSRDEDDTEPRVDGGIWDHITANGCRWRQVSSTDGGKTWTHHWIMHWTRATRA